MALERVPSTAIANNFICLAAENLTRGNTVRINCAGQASVVKLQKRFSRPETRV